jgi:hypothetical protein
LSDADGFESTVGPILKAACGVTGNDLFPVGLAAVDDNAFRPAMPAESLSEEAFGGGKIALLAEPELNRVTATVDGAIEIHPSAANLDIGLVGMPSIADGALAPIEKLDQQRSKVHDPAVDRRMIDADAAFGHHFLQIAQAQAIAQIPSHAQQDH